MAAFVSTRMLSGLIRLLLAAALVMPTWAARAQADDDDAKIKTVVVGLQGRRNVDEGLALAMTDVVQGELSLDKRRSVLGRTDIARVLAFESDKQALGCMDDSCLAEIASAMSVDRIIAGSMDKVGSSYFVVITEIDAQTVQPLGRVQERLPLDEDKLVEGIQRITRRLLMESYDSDDEATIGAGGAAAALDAAAGSGTIEVQSTPPGAEVFVNSVPQGKAPVTLADMPVGEAVLEVKLDDGAPFKVKVPVEKDATTTVRADRNVPPAPSDADVEAFESDYNFDTVSALIMLAAGTSIGCVGCLTGIVGIGALGANAIGQGAVIAIVGAAITAAGCGCCTWGSFTWTGREAVPVGSGPPIHRISIATPSGEDLRIELRSNNPSPNEVPPPEAAGAPPPEDVPPAQEPPAELPADSAEDDVDDGAEEGGWESADTPPPGMMF